MNEDKLDRWGTFADLDREIARRSPEMNAVQAEFERVSLERLDARLAGIPARIHRPRNDETPPEVVRDLGRGFSGLQVEVPGLHAIDERAPRGRDEDQRRTGRIFAVSHAHDAG